MLMVTKEIGTSGFKKYCGNWIREDGTSANTIETVKNIIYSKRHAKQKCSINNYFLAARKLYKQNYCMRQIFPAPQKVN